ERLGSGTADAQQRPHQQVSPLRSVKWGFGVVGKPTMPDLSANDGGHALQAAGPAAPGEPQQHGLRLVVEGVPEEYSGCPGALDRGGVRVVPRLTRGGLRTTLRSDLHAGDEHGVEAELARLFRGASRDIR